jgi:small subunit ribosomal protein S17
MRTLKGTVVSAKMQKTIVVRVDVVRRHPKYGKYHRLTRKFKVHDKDGEYRAGDEIVIRETRPISKEKRWEAAMLVRRPLTPATDAGSDQPTDNNPPITA